MLITIASLMYIPFAFGTLPKNKYIVLFFDDGWQNQYKVAYPILKSYRFTATFGIVTDLIGADQNTLWARMTTSQINDLTLNEFEIASHSVTHPYLTAMTYDEIMFELNQSKQVLASLTGKNITNFIIPFSDTNEQVNAEILQVYSHFRSWEGVIFAGSENLKNFKKEILSMGNVTFLCYHQLRKAHGSYITSPDLFAQEISWLFSQGYQVISFEKYLKL